MSQFWTTKQVKEYLINEMKERGVTLEDIAVIVVDMQKKYIPDVTMEDAIRNIDKVLDKREVQNSAITGIQLDKLAEKGLVEEPLLTMLQKDDGLYGIDEVVPLGIVNIYGTVGFTTFGYLDKAKPGIIGELDNHSSGQVHTFLDDVICGIVAAACSRLSHELRARESGKEQEKTKQYILKELAKKNVTVKNMAEIVMELQEKYVPELTLEIAEHNVHRVLEKREVQNSILTGLELDRLAEEGQLKGPLAKMIEEDDGLYGVDEIVPLGIVNVFGTIGFTNYGYLDQEKRGIIKELDNHKEGEVNTFIDDIVSAIIASACSRIAHNDRE